MDISNVIKAVQKTSHLSNSQMRSQYPELYQIKEEEKIKELGLNTKQAAQSLVAEIKETACRL
jgi:CRISPR/Cas system CSM-associated protein Csm2 small subunit